MTTGSETPDEIFEYGHHPHEVHWDYTQIHDWTLFAPISDQARTLYLILRSMLRDGGDPTQITRRLSEDDLLTLLSVGKKKRVARSSFYKWRAELVEADMIVPADETLHSSTGRGGIKKVARSYWVRRHPKPGSRAWVGAWQILKACNGKLDGNIPEAPTVSDPSVIVVRENGQRTDQDFYQGEPAGNQEVAGHFVVREDGRGVREDGRGVREDGHNIPLASSFSTPNKREEEKLGKTLSPRTREEDVVADAPPESETPRPPSIEEITGPGAAVAYREAGPSVPRQPTGTPDWMGDLVDEFFRKGHDPA